MVRVQVQWGTKSVETGLFYLGLKNLALLEESSDHFFFSFPVMFQLISYMVGTH